MNKLIILLAVCLLSGCGDSGLGNAAKPIRDNCRGTLTVELKVSSLIGDSLTVTCSEDVSDESRAKHKEKEQK